MSDELIPDDAASSIADPAGPGSDDVPSISDPADTDGDESSIAPGGNADDE